MSCKLKAEYKYCAVVRILTFYYYLLRLYQLIESTSTLKDNAGDGLKNGYYHGISCKINVINRNNRAERLAKFAKPLVKLYRSIHIFRDKKTEPNRVSCQTFFSSSKVYTLHDIYNLLAKLTNIKLFARVCIVWTAYFNIIFLHLITFHVRKYGLAFEYYTILFFMEFRKIPSMWKDQYKIRTYRLIYESKVSH